MHVPVCMRGVMCICVYEGCACMYVRCVCVCVRICGCVSTFVVHMRMVVHEHFSKLRELTGIDNR